MSMTTSRDGTHIGFTRRGEGPPLILVDGALCYRESGPNESLAQVLAADFSVITYDRRGRGGSGDTQPYAIEREVEDIEALVREAGGAAHLYGISSGAAVALEAANADLSVDRLALYEAPFVVDSTRLPVPPDIIERMEDLLRRGRRADVVRLFMTQGVRVPGVFVTLMRFMPAWSRLKGVAHTLPYDMRFVLPYETGEPLPRDRWTRVTAPTLVIGGGKSPAWIKNAMKALADVVPGAQHLTLPGQTHMVKNGALAPVLTRFFKGEEAGAAPIAYGEKGHEKA